MSALRRFCGSNHLHFITTSTYRRARWGFKIIGYVLMPEHFHLLVWPSEEADPSAIIKSLKERTARFMLRNLLAHPELPWCRKTLGQLHLPPTVHDESRYRVGQRRFCDTNIWTEKKRLEKLNYLHANPVKRGLVESPEQWPWSSFRYYYLQDASWLAMDRLP